MALGINEHDDGAGSAGRRRPGKNRVPVKDIDAHAAAAFNQTVLDQFADRGDDGVDRGAVAEGQFTDRLDALARLKPA